MEVEDINRDTLKMRILGNRLGRIYEHLPGFGFISKSWGKCTLYLSYKLKKFLLEYRKFLLDHISQGMLQKYKISKSKIHEVTFPESTFNICNSMEQRLKYVRKRFPLLTWDTRYKELIEIV